MRKLRVSTSILREVAGNKDAIDALAFAMLIKQAYVSSVVVNATISNLKQKFGMGSDKLRKVLSSCIKFGFIRREGKDIIANRLHGNKSLTYIFKARRFYEAKKGKGRLSVIGVRSMIEEAIIVNHVKIQNECADTHYRASHPLNADTLRSARRREKRMLRKPYEGRFSGLSNSRIQELIGRKHGKASKTIKNAIAHRLLKKQFRVEGIDMKGDPCNYVTRSMLEGTSIIVWARTRCAFVRYSNEYKCIGGERIINKANNGRYVA